MRRSLSLIALLILCAVCLAACGSSNKCRRRPRPPPLDDRGRECTQGERSRPVQRRRADRRHRLAGLPAVLRGQQACQRQGLRERRRLRDRQATRLLARRRQVGRRAVQRAPTRPARSTSTSTSTRSRSRPTRSKAVDFSSPYFTAPQAIVVPEGLQVRERDVAGRLQGREVRRADRHDEPRRGQRARSSRRSRRRRSSTTPTTSCTALKENLVDAVVVDLPTAFYITSAQVEGSTIAGQFKAPGGDTWGALLAKGSPLTACVSKAVAKLQADGTLAKIQTQWMGGASAPELPVRSRPPEPMDMPVSGRRAAREAARRARARRSTTISAIVRPCVVLGGLHPAARHQPRAGPTSARASFVERVQALVPERPARASGSTCRCSSLVEAIVLVFGSRDRALPHLAARRGCSRCALVLDGLHRRLPRHPDDPARLPRRLRRPGAPGLGPEPQRSSSGCRCRPTRSARAASR